jgi:hypothetical protein
MTDAGETTAPDPVPVIAGVKQPLRLNRKVLLQAWAQLSVYDQTAFRLKDNFIKRRQFVIILSLVATIASVLTGILEQPIFTAVLVVLSVALPVIASYLMNDITRFTGTTSWIKYRYIAEMMRMHIYLYRMQAGDYSVGPASKMDNLLAQKLPLIRDEIKWDEIIPPSVREPEGEEAIIKAIGSANSGTGDDGLSEISIENYIKWRVEQPRAWYTKKINDDFNGLKSSVRWAQGFLLIGALISALVGVINIEFVALVAVTNAISAALTAWSSVSMVGKTYSIFQIASNQLGDELNKWNAIQDDLENQVAEALTAEQANFALRIENIHLWERQEWYEMALQAQSSGDRMMLGDLTRLTQRAEKAREESNL